MTNQRDSSDLLVPIERAIEDAQALEDTLRWDVAHPDVPAEVARKWLEIADRQKAIIADLIRRRDAGETHEVMF